MNILFFVILTLFLIILQTVIFPFFPWFLNCFDLMIINILFLSLMYSNYAVVLAIIFIGGIMDSISGVPFFLHIFSYLWIYMIVQLFKQFVFQRSMVFIFIVGFVSVLIQQGLIVFSVFSGQGQAGVGQLDFTVMARQVLWGGLFIPPGVWLFNVLKQNWVYVLGMFKKEFVRKYWG